MIFNSKTCYRLSSLSSTQATDCRRTLHVLVWAREKQFIPRESLLEYQLITLVTFYFAKPWLCIQLPWWTHCKKCQTNTNLLISKYWIFLVLGTTLNLSVVSWVWHQTNPLLSPRHEAELWPCLSFCVCVNEIFCVKSSWRKGYEDSCSSWYGPHSCLTIWKVRHVDSFTLCLTVLCTS